MPGAYDVQKSKLILKTADELKKLNEIKPPVWSAYVKTGAHKERPPVLNDWWFQRSASVLCAVEALGPIGVAKLRTKYGGKKNRGHKPEKFYKASGNILRKVLQQLEKAGFIKQATIKGHKGRVITPKGKAFLDQSAKQIPQERQEKKAPSPKQEQKPSKKNG
ncbi:30S ribosomal protein S19e [Candidatus Woesearchaeota archaeon]|nr:30S ribosomal protein S19e [Candidatus Woesearchaeota archaeon]